MPCKKIIPNIRFQTKNTIEIHGIQGPTGPPGPSGPHGITGLQGIIGPIGTFGSPGILGPPGISGENGFPGIEGIPGNQGAIGRRGDTGINGPRGMSGITGPTGDNSLSNHIRISNNNLQILKPIYTLRTEAIRYYTPSANALPPNGDDFTNIYGSRDPFSSRYGFYPLVPYYQGITLNYIYKDLLYYNHMNHNWISNNNGIYVINIPGLYFLNYYIILHQFGSPPNILERNPVQSYHQIGFKKPDSIDNRFAYHTMIHWVELSDTPNFNTTNTYSYVHSNQHVYDSDEYQSIDSSDTVLLNITNAMKYFRIRIYLTGTKELSKPYVFLSFNNIPNHFTIRRII